MERNKLFIETAFACMASDGSINDQELNLVKSYLTNDGLYKESEIDQALGKLVTVFNQDSNRFMLDYFTELESENLTSEDQISIIKYAISIIKADDVIDYREIRFFKKIRSCLSVSDSEIMDRIDDIEEFLERDISNNLGFEDNKFYGAFDNNKLSLVSSKQKD